MVLPKRKLAPPAKSPAAKALPGATLTDSYGITYIGDSAVVTVSMDAKLSRNYQSLGTSAGIEFRTPVEGLDETIKKAMKKVRAAMQDELKIISDALDTL